MYSVHQSQKNIVTFSKHPPYDRNILLPKQCILYIFKSCFCTKKCQQYKTRMWACGWQMCISLNITSTNSLSRPTSTRFWQCLHHSACLQVSGKPTAWKRHKYSCHRHSWGRWDIARRKAWSSTPPGCPGSGISRRKSDTWCRVCPPLRQIYLLVTSHNTQVRTQSLQLQPSWSVLMLSFEYNSVIWCLWKLIFDMSLECDFLIWSFWYWMSKMMFLGWCDSQIYIAFGV